MADAKIKIKEGTLRVGVGHTNQNHSDLEAVWTPFKKGDKVKIEFVDHHTKYTFVDGILV